MADESWTYQGHLCEITLDEEPDVIKAWHEVTKPDGTKLFADISPYDRRRTTLNRWIDAGYPTRDQGEHPKGPLKLQDLEWIISQKVDHE